MNLSKATTEDLKAFAAFFRIVKNYMKMKELLITLIICLAFISCEPTSGSTSEERKIGDYSIKVIDSCEYVEYSYGVGISNGAAYAITHKGNCKFCKQRGLKP
jgi:hypothetical protein